MSSGHEVRPWRRMYVLSLTEVYAECHSVLCIASPSEVVGCISSLMEWLLETVDLVVTFLKEYNVEGLTLSIKVSDGRQSRIC